MQHILILGGHGQLASALLHHQQAHQFKLSAVARQEADITNLNTLKHCIDQHQPDIIINTAAYTAVDKAESETTQAMQANHLGAKHIAQVCEDFHLPLIHISTDYIFDGTEHTPYQEDHLPHPINFYGQSKWLGEEAVREHCTQHLIVRVSGVFSEFGSNFFKTILRLAQERPQLRIVNDQITCPTYAGDIAGALFALAQQLNHWGTYHYCSQDAVSWYDFASAIVQHGKTFKPIVTTDIQGISTADYPTAAKRPAYSVLNCDKIHQTFGIAQPTWKNSLTLERMYQ